MTNIEYINSKLFLYVIFIKGDSSSALACYSTCISTKKKISSHSGICCS